MRVPREVFSTRVYDVGAQRLWVVFMPASEAPKTGMFWINPGVGISTRQAEEALASIGTLKQVDDLSVAQVFPRSIAAEPTFHTLKERVISLVNRSPLTSDHRPTSKDVYLFPTGMAAIYRLHTYLLAKYSRPSVLFGFAFHSTHHIFEDFHPAQSTPEESVLSLGNADEVDLVTLRAYLTKLKSENKSLQALWTEFPSNPNCITPDLHALRALADEFSFPVIIDDTVAGTANVDVLPLADVLVTSLTKSFSGYADVMGGCITLNPASRWYSTLTSLLEESYSNELYHLDASHLLANSADMLPRTAIHNRNHVALVELFTQYTTGPTPLLTNILSPLTAPSRPFYDAHLRPATSELPSPGHGLLLSIDFRSVVAIAAFHDALNLYKTPHLGAHVTLVLPYVKGLYADQLERVGQWGLKETQMRVAPGLEDEAELLEVFTVALDAAERAGKDGAEEGANGTGAGDGEGEGEGEGTAAMV
jgi:cystathionine gamma-synthase